MEIFKSVKTYIGVLAAIVGAMVMIYKETLQSGILKNASDLVIPISLVFFIIAAVLFVLGFIEISKKEIASETATTKAKIDADAKKVSIIEGEDSEGIEAKIKGKDALIKANNSKKSKFEIDTSETPSENEKKNNESE